MIKTRKVLLLVSAVLLLAGCATGPEPPAPEQTLEERAQARWEALIARDYGEAYQYQSPGFRRSNPMDAFARDQGRRPFNFLFAEVQGSECEQDDRCTVTVRVRYQPTSGPAELRRMRPYRNLQETWLRIDDQWWFVQN